MTVQHPLEVSGNAPGLPEEEAAAAAGSDPAEDYCVTATSADECRSMVDKTGETCSWCTSESIPATCLPPALAKVWCRWCPSLVSLLGRRSGVFLSVSPVFFLSGCWYSSTYRGHAVCFVWGPI